MEGTKFGNRMMWVSQDTLCRPGTVLFQKEIDIDELPNFTTLLHTSIISEGHVPVNCIQTTLNAVGLLPRDRAQHDGYLSEAYGSTPTDIIDNYIQSLIPYEVSQTLINLDSTKKLNDTINLLEENLKVGYATIVFLIAESGMGHMGMFFKDGDGRINMFEGQHKNTCFNGILDKDYILSHIVSNKWVSIVFYCVSEKKRKLEHGIRQKPMSVASKPRMPKLPSLSSRKRERMTRYRNLIRTPKSDTKPDAKPDAMDIVFRAGSKKRKYSTKKLASKRISKLSSVKTYK